MSVNNPAMCVENLTKNFGRMRALDEVSFDVPVGSIYGLLGPNGAGKTTLFSIAAGFLKPTGGTIDVLDVDIENVSELRGRLAILPQDAMFQSNVPILEQLFFLSQLDGFSKEDARERAFKALDRVGLGDAAKKNARTLSHGMTKRLGIAQAFLNDPEVILLDEPTAGLDPANARGIRKLIADLHSQSVTVIISSHNLREIQEICTHYAILDHGTLIHDGAMAELTKSGTIVRMTFARDLSHEEMKAIRTTPGVHALRSESEKEYLLELNLADGKTQDEVVSAVVQNLMPFGGLIPRSIDAGASLESRFLEITGGLDLEDDD